MIDIIEKKIADLKEELALQHFTQADNDEIEKLVLEYRKELKAEKEEQYEANKIILNAKIEALEETRNEMLNAQVEEKQQEETPQETTSTINPLI